MFIISNRRNFWDPEEIATETVLSDVQPDFSEGPFSWEDLAGKRVLFLIHGDADLKEEVLSTYLYLESQFQSFIDSYDAVVGYLWSRHASFAQAGLVKEVLEKIASSSVCVDLMVHGIGNRLVLEACREIKECPLFRKFISTSPAIGFESIAQSSQFLSHFQHLFIFHSREDCIPPFLSAILVWDKSRGFDALHSSSNMQFIDCSEVVDGYENYWNCPEIFQLLKADAMGILPKNVSLELLPGGRLSCCYY